MLKAKRNQANQIFQIIKIKNKKKWTKEEDSLLIKLAEKYKEKHWKEISRNFVNKNSLQCFSRYKRIRPGIIKGSWSKDEDDKILHLVQIYGKSWSKISKVLSSRNGKQIRDRFINVLDPEIKKGKFTEEEDKSLIRLYIYYGPKWATISKHFTNRTADMIKNRFHSSIKKIFFHGEPRNSKVLKNLRDKYSLVVEESLNEQYYNEYKEPASSNSVAGADTAYVTNTNVTSSMSFSFPTSKNLSPSNSNPCIIKYEMDNNANVHNVHEINHGNDQDHVKSADVEYITQLSNSNVYQQHYANYDIKEMSNQQENYSIDGEENFFNFDDYFTV